MALSTSAFGVFRPLDGLLVARTGFEPVISALRGRCPWPLDERAVKDRRWLGIEDSNLGLQSQNLSSYH